ncbi:MAG: aminopeptidase [Lachnospiraceae bacterium]|nr:aminopeptidase [Lachnospiraceae bacterium]
MSFYGIEEAKIREYARLVVCTGVNVQPGQEVIIRCPVEYYEFGHLLIEEAYKAGAAEVLMRWNDTFDSRQYYLYASEEALCNVPEWKAESYNYYSRRGAAYISIAGGDPEAFKGVDPKRMQMNEAAMDKALETHYKLMMASEIPWTVAAVPQKKWAAKVFPELPEAEAMKRLWELILKAVRIGDNDAVKEWEKHDTFLKSKCRMLNDYAFEKLHYKNSIGTDFTVGLAKGHIWEGGSETAGTGTVFEANMPTEEIFTMPDSRVAEGTLVSALPLSYRGNLIRNFSLTFHEGQVVDYSAQEGYETLKSLLETDEGSKRLGEVAIVPYTSPISQMKTLFYNTLFDENASCHFALGECYPTTVAGGAAMSEEELKAVGGNSSINHVDFMVGTADLCITGIREDGTETVIFENGDWV